MSTHPPEGRPLGPSRVEAARGGPRVPLFALGVAVLAALLVAGVVVARVAADDDEELTADAASSPAAGPQAFGPVTVDGEGLPGFTGDDDPAVGRPAPSLTGETPAGEPVAIEPGDGPLLIAFLAHWCPHCQAEVPRLVDLADGAGEIDGVRLVAVATGSDSRAENFPPGDWLAREGWPGPVLLDAEPQGEDPPPAAAAYGLAGYPFLVAVDADGTVVARTSGELGHDGLRDVAARAAAGE